MTLRMANYLFALLLAIPALLSGCGLVTINETLNIEDPQTLNGVWTSVLSDYEKTKNVTVRLELTASSINAQLYSVKGTMQLDGGELLDVAGEVRAGQIPGAFDIGSPSFFKATASKSAEVLWEMGGFRYHNDGLRWNLSMSGPQDFDGLSGEIIPE
jgi:hypothetical protein